MKITLIFCILFSLKVMAGESLLKIDLASGNQSEKKAKELIEGFEKNFNLQPYIFTKNIRIQTMVIPHSHPILTLNTREISDPDKYLSLLLHEQIHWFFADKTREEKTQKFIDKMKLKYPIVPSMKDGGASDDNSTYLHFGVCYFEFQAITNYLGQEKAETIFKTETVYSWIRKEILSDQGFIKNMLEETGLQWEAANSH